MSDFTTQISQRLQQLEYNYTESTSLSSLPLFEAESRLSQNKTSLKRPRHGAFDMSVVLEASKEVEDSIAFPVIEWPSLDNDDKNSEKDDDEDDDAAFCFSTSPAKRQCRGLVRCRRSSNLSALTRNSSNHSDPAIVAMNSVQRRGSNGSLV
jgi:hypothetical protein